jgi:polyhydroxybutyrate depolymerase
MNALRMLNGCAAAGIPWGEHCTLFPSASGTPVVEFVHPGGHEFPKGRTAAIAPFFKEHPGK